MEKKKKRRRDGKELISTHCHGQRRGCEGEMEEDDANYCIPPAEKQENPLVFYKGACRDVIPW